jgi:hypothetical protein
MYGSKLISALYKPDTERRRIEAEAKAGDHLCEQAAERYGHRGLDCFSRAWVAALGMERTFAGSGKQLYDEACQACIARP